MIRRTRKTDNKLYNRKLATDTHSSRSSSASSKPEMKYIFVSTVVLLTITVATHSNNLFRGLRLRVPHNSYQQQLPYDSSEFYFSGEERDREDRGLFTEPQPMCKEIRTELPASLYVPNLENAEIYTFRPQKIYMVNCSREADERAQVGSGCRPQHCREKYVDIDIFGKPKTVKENLWQLMMEIPSVPIACECFRTP